MISKALLFVTCIFSFIGFCSAQIDPLQLNKKLLEHEIKILIDSTRCANNLAILLNDSILYVASNHHAQFLLSKGILSHEELGSKQFLSPQDRANYYGVGKNYFVGENIAYTAYNSNVKSKNKTFLTNNYKEIARSLVHSWVNSKGHFKNIVSPKYQVTGLAIALDLKTQRIYACQKFAYVAFTYSFPLNTTFFPYAEVNQDSLRQLTEKKYAKEPYPFGLKDNKIEQCEECKDTWAEYPSMSVRISKNYFILRVENADFVKELIQNKFDGFAIEIVRFDAFANGNPAYENEPSRRNNEKRTSGKLLEPIYRNELVKGFKIRKKARNISFVKYILTADSVSFFKRFGRYKLENFSAKYFEIKLGRVPKELDMWWNHNLVYIHNKQICHFVYLTNYPGEMSTNLVAVDYFPPIPVNDYSFKLEYFKDSLDLFYAPGATVTESQALNRVIANFIEHNLTIIDVKIEGFCSVEGDSLVNEKLHHERVKNILGQFESLTEKSTNYDIQSRVAWNHFYASVKNHPKWNFLSSLSKKEVSDYFANTKNERPLDLLSQERKVKVEIVAVKMLSPKNSKYYYQRDLNSLFYKDGKGLIRCSDPDALEKLYEKAYYLTTVDTFSIKDLLTIQIPKFKEGYSHRLLHDMAFYKYEYLHKSATKSELAKLELQVESVFKQCGAAEHLSPEFHYLSACLLAKRIVGKGSKNVEDNGEIQKAFDRLNLLLESYKHDSTFLLNVSKANLNIIYVLCENIDAEQMFKYTDIINSSLIQIVEYERKSQRLNPKSALQLAQMLCYFKNISLAIDVCKDFLDDNEILKLYLPLSYYHSSFLSSVEEVNYEIEFHRQLMEARTRLTATEWCKLFYGNMGIPFQVMDNQLLHAEFCATCPNRVNEIFEEE